MTSRVQTLRSSTTGNTPASGTRQAGELWLNFADFQLGMIDASRNAQKLVAVRYFQTTANYSAGDMVVQAGALYIANGSITAGAFERFELDEGRDCDRHCWYRHPCSVFDDAGDGWGGDGRDRDDIRARRSYSPERYEPRPLGVTGLHRNAVDADRNNGVTQTAGDNSTKLATTAYVGAAIAASPPVVPNPNRLDNGDMWVDQHNNGASVAVPAAGWYLP